MFTQRHSTEPSGNNEACAIAFEPLQAHSCWPPNRVWNVRTAECEQVLKGHQDAILHGALTSNGQRLATASMDSTVRIWEPRTGRCTHVLTAHQGWVKAVAFANHGHTVITGGLDKKVLDVMHPAAKRALPDVGRNV